MRYAIFNSTTGAIRCIGDTARDVWRRQLGQPEKMVNKKDEFTGRVYSTPSTLPFEHNGEVIAELDRPGLQDDTHYIDPATFEVLDRPVLTLPVVNRFNGDGADQFRILGLPVGTVAIINGETYTIDDGELILISDAPKSYRIELFPTFPFQEVKPFSVSAT